MLFLSNSNNIRFWLFSSILKIVEEAYKLNGVVTNHTFWYGRAAEDTGTHRPH